MVTVFSYEQGMFPRSASFYDDARKIIDICLGDNAPTSFIDFFSGSPSEEGDVRERP